MNLKPQPPETLVVEEPFRFGDHEWYFRRNNDDPGEASWQVFRDDRFTPAGFLRAVHQPTESAREDGWQLAVSDTNGQPIGKPGKRDAPGTVPAVNYVHQALSWLLARERGDA